MKKLIVPLVGALVTGLLGASAFSYTSAKKTAALIAEHRADSIKTHIKDSTEAYEKAEKAEAAKLAAAAAEEALPLTPADSIRALRHEPTTLGDATRGLPNASEPKHGVAAAVLPPHGEAKPVAALKNRKTEAPTPEPSHAAPNADPAHAASDVVEGALPERRIAKIFGAMQSKDAARVLEQMNDSDVRVILSMMGDKQAASILSSFSPQRAAAISKAGAARPEVSKSDKKPTGAKS